jgi:hypothetical protein
LYREIENNNNQNGSKRDCRRLDGILKLYPILEGEKGGRKSNQRGITGCLVGWYYPRIHTYLVSLYIQSNPSIPPANQPITNDSVVASPTAEVIRLAKHPTDQQTNRPTAQGTGDSLDLSGPREWDAGRLHDDVCMDGEQASSQRMIQGT